MISRMYSMALPRTTICKFLEQLKDHEKVGVPKNAGINCEQGFNLGRMRKLVTSLGNPLSTYPVVHIAGTKGKGSTAAFLSNILQASGYKVGTYTSPHLRTIRERISIGGPISADALEDLFQSVQGTLVKAVASESLTHFEVFTALAFKYFAQENVDIAVVETGLGGTRDATNIIQPEGLAAAVISSIGEEHLEALGGSLQSIALAKAGIIKHGRPVVLSPQVHPSVEDVLHERAAEEGAFVIRASSPSVKGIIKNYCKVDNEFFQMCDFEVSRGFQVGHGKCLDEEIHLTACKLRMFGPHQIENALTSISTALCLREQGWKIPDSALRIGLETTSLPGRFQVLSLKQASALGPNEATIVLDGAHTAGSAAVLATTLRSLFPKEPLVLIIAMASDKDYAAFASALLEAKPVSVVLSKVDIAGSNARSASVESLLEAWTPLAAARHNRMQVSEVKIFVTQSMDAAVATASGVLKAQQSPGVICITGSLHAVSNVLEICC